MTFLISAKNESQADWISTDVEADTWEDAFQILRLLARKRWPGQLWRPTAVMELPRTQPIALAIHLEDRRGA